MRRLLVSLALIVSLGLITAAPGQAANCDALPGWPATDTGVEAEVLRLVNVHRASIGLGSLTSSSSLERAAEWKAQHMAVYGYMAHDDPAPPIARGAFQRFVDCGYSFSGRGENIAYGYSTPASVMAAWLSSPGHRVNIEGSGFRAIGVGATRSASGVWYWAQTFGSTVEAFLPPPNPPPACTPPSPGASPGGWPVPIPKWYWPWERWRLGLLAQRPASAPTTIKPWAWRRLKATLAYRRCMGL